MGGLFRSPKTIAAPIVPEVEPIPTVGDIDKPARKRRRGRGETILTGELEPVTTKKTLLGGL